MTENSAHYSPSETVTIDVSSPYSTDVTRYALLRPLLIGRAPSADIRLLDPRVSREHARLTLSEHGRFVVEDLNSTNGTGAAARLLRGEHVALHVPAVVHIEPFVLVARREQSSADETVQTPRGGDLRLRPLPDGGLSIDGVLVRAAPLERRLLEILAVHYPDAVIHSVLGDGVWGAGGWASYMLQNLVRRCRVRLHEAGLGGPHSIESIRGVGYRIILARNADAQDRDG